MGDTLVFTPELLTAIGGLHGNEESTCHERVACPLFRSLRLSLADDDGNVEYNIERPFVCEPLQCWPLCFLQSQSIRVKDHLGNIIAQAQEPGPQCCHAGFTVKKGGIPKPQCCTRTYDAQDARGNSLYVLTATQCRPSSGPTNCCAPSCLNKTFDVDVLDPVSGEHVTTATFLWPGCNAQGTTDRANVILRLPSDASPAHRVALLGAVLLVEYTEVERKRQFDCSNGAGLLGTTTTRTAPANPEEMAR